MSGNANPVNPNKPKKILMIAANPAVSSQTGWNIGFWFSEITHPYWEFTENGYEVEIRSPNGGKLVADGYSDPEDTSGYSASDLISLGFKHSPAHKALLENTKSIADVNIADYDAVFVTGGQSPMYSMIDHTALHNLIAAFYQAGKITAAICHGTCVLLKAKKSDGTLIVEGKTWTGFANSEEQFADNFVGQRIQPFWIEDEAKKIPNTNFIVAQPFVAHAVRDGNLITGQQQFSGTAAAKMLIEALGR
ncbi:MAG: type 1 glutamine amidotransferase domain-containing protein [Deinococcales bacterium]